MYNADIDNIFSTFEIKIKSKLKYTRKYPLRGYFLAPPGRRKRVTLKREKKIFGQTDYRPQIDHGLTTNEQTDMEVEIVF